MGLILMQLEAVAFCNFQRPFARFLPGRKFADKAVDAFAGRIVLRLVEDVERTIFTIILFQVIAMYTP